MLSRFFLPKNSVVNIHFERLDSGIRQVSKRVIKLLHKVNKS
ncbi:hypothetical protein P20480_1258 [Pseudoalteromonas sp. BSi20480]|jgi:hypothetical protein|nr:hypothetical protein P20480_1258 [Pseudoalteromonas sp. BSi20480]